MCYQEGVIPVLDTGIQKSLLVSKQTSIESGYNVFDKIAERLDSSVWALG
ncbi:MULTISPECIES: hypothetical protein [Wolbachia]|nr:MULTISPECIES: hypothetical protein [unclassified Wolbachia]MBS9530485.1 hypothetical protein [Wolbachia endosymbiont of Rhagoletis cerasi]